MSTNVTSSAAAAATTGCTNLYVTPTQDANCAMSYGGNHTDIMNACCNGAEVVSYYNDCGLFCLAVDQTVGELTSCLFDKGAGWNDVFCSGNTTASATATSVSLAASASASVVSGDDDDSDSSSSSTATGTGSSSSSTSSSTGTSSAASGTKPQPFVNTMGLAIGALLFSAVAFGAQQI